MAFDFNTFGTTPETNTQPKVVGFDFNTFGSTVDTTIAPKVTADQQSAKDYNAIFPSKTGEGPLKAGLKALGNVPSSAINLAKGIGSALLHPIQTVKGLGSIAVGGVEKLIPGQQAQEQNFNQFSSFLKERYGSLENLQRTATNDPFGFGTDILSLVSGVAGATGRTAQLARGIETTGQLVTKPVARASEAVSSSVGKTTKFGVSQATGLAPETISNIIENPQTFTPEALKETTRVNLGSTVKDAIDARLENLSDIGSGYETIKQLPVKVAIPPQTVESVLNKYGIKVVDGKVKTTAESKPLTSADRIALEDFLSVYGNETELSANAFLNARSGLSQLSKYDSAKTGNLTPIARELRGIYDDLGKNQIPGLSELDATYAPEVRELSQIKKDYLTATGEFKDGAINKIANLTGPGKEQVLNRLEKIIPGVTQRIKIVKAAEDIEKAAGLKVGTYARAGLGVFGLSTANIPAILTAIVASPEIAVRLLRAYGYTNKTAQPIINALYGMANDVNNFRLPGMMQEYITEYIKNPKAGMSIEDVTRSQPELIPKIEKTEKIQSQVSSPKTNTNTPVKSIPEATKKEMIETIDYLRLDKPVNAKNEQILDSLSQKYNISLDSPKNKIADQLENLVEKTKTSQAVIKPVIKPSPQSSLLTEAKKYKSAEEFVKAQPTVYHGTPDFRFAEEFNPTQKGYYPDAPGLLPDNTGFSGVVRGGFSDTNPLGRKGIFFTDNKSVAKSYSNKPAFDNQNSIPAVLERKLIMNNPKIIDKKGAKWHATDKEVEQAIKEGYDGIIIKNVRDNYHPNDVQPVATNYVVFSKDQIKTNAQLADIWKKSNSK